MRAALPLVLLLTLSACDMRMREQDRPDPPDPPLPGFETSGPAFAIAREAATAPQARPPLDAPLLERGRVAYDAYCAPCHDRTGHGRGIVVQRGFPEAANLHEARLRAADPAWFVEVISDGYGVMPAYAERVELRDRWAIAAYVQALQLAGEAAEAEE